MGTGNMNKHSVPRVFPIVLQLCVCVVYECECVCGTWLQGGLQLQDQLLGLHVEQPHLPAGEGGDHVGGVSAHQVHRGGNTQLWRDRGERNKKAPQSHSLSETSLLQSLLSTCRWHHKLHTSFHRQTLSPPLLWLKVVRAGPVPLASHSLREPSPEQDSRRW